MPTLKFGPYKLPDGRIPRVGATITVDKPVVKTDGSVLVEGKSTYSIQDSLEVELPATNTGDTSPLEWFYRITVGKQQRLVSLPSEVAEVTWDLLKPSRWGQEIIWSPTGETPEPNPNPTESPIGIDADGVPYLK